MMSNGVTFEQVEQLAVRLPPPEQLKLVACISEQLSSLMATIAPSGMEFTTLHDLSKAYILK